MKIIFILLCSIYTTVALAHDHEHPELNDWYSSLHSSQGSPCCDKDDFDKGSATSLSDADWDSKNGHYRVRIGGDWVDVPDSAIVTGPNKDGRPIVWFYNTYAIGAKTSTPIIRCFIPGAGG